MFFFISGKDWKQKFILDLEKQQQHLHTWAPYIKKTKTKQKKKR